MRNKLFILGIFLCVVFGSFAQVQTQEDSLKAVAINKEAENPNFIHAYLLDISPGKAFYSTFGHEAIRLVCPSKGLDYCYSFEINMKESSKLDVFTRSAKAGYGMIPSAMFLELYRKEGRGVTAYELNLKPKEKQELWRFLDKRVSDGSSWTFGLSINCLSMVVYALNSAIMPEQMEFKQLPDATNLCFGDWMDYITRQSPWINLAFHASFINTDGSKLIPADKITPEMVKEVIPRTVIISQEGKARPLVIGSPKTLLQQHFHDSPCWFKPWMAILLLVLILIILFYGKEKLSKK